MQTDKIFAEIQIYISYSKRILSDVNFKTFIDNLLNVLFLL